MCLVLSNIEHASLQMKALNEILAYELRIGRKDAHGHGGIEKIMTERTVYKESGRYSDTIISCKSGEVLGGCLSIFIYWQTNLMPSPLSVLAVVQASLNSGNNIIYCILTYFGANICYIVIAAILLNMLEKTDERTT